MKFTIMMKKYIFSLMELPDIELLVQLHPDKVPKKKDQSKDQQYLKYFFKMDIIQNKLHNFFIKIPPVSERKCTKP